MIIVCTIHYIMRTGTRMLTTVYRYQCRWVFSSVQFNHKLAVGGAITLHFIITYTPVEYINVMPKRGRSVYLCVRRGVHIELAPGRPWTTLTFVLLSSDHLTLIVWWNEIEWRINNKNCSTGFSLVLLVNDDFLWVFRSLKQGASSDTCTLHSYYGPWGDSVLLYLHNTS